MQSSFLDNLPVIKAGIREYAQTAQKNGWIEPKDCADVIKRIDEDTITIGVIGQMKAGKSTFLNALLFGKEVLPAASTPMTAALTEITYGEIASIEAEFYTRDEWEQIKIDADKPEDTPKVQAAKELVEKSGKLGGQLNSLLGSKKKAAFGDLMDYVGAEGKYVAITKSAKIVYPLDMLKGMQIVDTPGFNDPVVSREERSMQFLAKADVVILLLYSGRAFDETDSKIIFEKVRGVGVGKIIIAINKYDVDIEKGEIEENLQNYVKEKIRKTVSEKNDETLNKLLGNPNPILFSAYMALLAKKPLSEIQKDETEYFHYKRLCNDVFSDMIHSQQDMFEKSRLAILQGEIDTLLKKEKVEILVDKSLNFIKAKIDTKRADYDKGITEYSEKIKTLSLNPEELEEKQHDAERAQKKIARTIDSMETDLKDFVSEKITNTVRNLGKKRNAAITNMQHSIESANVAEEAQSRVNVVLMDIQQEFKDEFEELNRKLKTELRAKSEDTISEMSDIIERFFSDDEEKSKDYINSCKSELQKFNDISTEEMFATGKYEVDEDDNYGDNIAGYVGIFFRYATFGALGGIAKKFGWQHGGKQEMLESVESYLPAASDLKVSFEPLRQLADEFVAFFRKRFDDDLVSLILKQIDEAKRNFAEREQNKKTAEADLAKVEAEKKQFEEQVKEANTIINALPL
jgi:GTP-binding protein EngB required for normal cell division